MVNVGLYLTLYTFFTESMEQGLCDLKAQLSQCGVARTAWSTLELTS